MNPILGIILVGLALAILAIQLYLLRKVRRIDLNTWAMKDQLPQTIAEQFRQMEALQSLYWDLKPIHAFLPTRGWAGSPDMLRTLASHVFEHKPGVVVECSCGVSTVVLARACQLNGGGHVYSLEHGPEFAAATRQQLSKQGLDDWATVIDAPLVETDTDIGTQPWYEISKLEPTSIDMLVIDGPPEFIAPLARYPAGPVLFQRLSEKGWVFLDDADRPAEKSCVERWLAQDATLSGSRQPAEKGLAILRKTDQVALDSK